MKNDNVVEITGEHKQQSWLVNSLANTLRRFSTSLGFGISPDGKRNYNDLYGYGETLNYSDYYGMYKRSGFGNVVVNKVVKACWKELPKIMSGDTEILESEMQQLSKVGFFRKMERADTLNRIGTFSVLLMGMPDGMDLDMPVGTARDISGMYFNPYNFDGIEILEWDVDPSSQRFGLPVKYQLQTTSFGEKLKDINRVTVVAHYTRIVHLAEGALDSSIEGASSLEAVFNSLTDVNKVRGGSAEAYFRNSRQQRALLADKDASLDKGSSALTTLNENIENFDNGWDSTLRLKNMQVNQLNPSLVSPRDTYDVSVEEISGQTGIPVRILTGKGGGQTSGVEDRASWNALVADRQTSECDQYLIDALTLMSDAGMFDLPDDVTIEWEPLADMSEGEQSVTNKTKAETLGLVIGAMNTPVGDELEAESVFKEFGLEDIVADYSAIDDIETDSAADEAAKIALAKLGGKGMPGEDDKELDDDDPKKVVEDE